MGTSTTSPNDWMIKNGNGKMADNVFAGAGGWYVTHPDGQVELIHAMSGVVESPVNPANIMLAVNPVDGEYSVGAGDVITFVINWTEPVTVTGVPQISFNENAVLQTADYVAADSTATSSVFEFTVTTEGVIDTVVETIGLNLGTIISTDDGVTAAVLTFNAGYAQPTGVTVVA